ncbi:hypothetical protein BBO99_00006282 [Phytophthora kernoviae]|uniref:Uncharacterized protein n=2 Tax=Phytophthora kernoviae TaxID=325452 RepID=A0A421F2Y3_9STRA|nr:hypothetical protein G195_007205 [Phytophthora kernoviae 00238/432]KAG2526995.1 hypothetical protein JM16_002363 [Phytophthora kernoviae]RLN20456.1 hypothetical protein BBI17_006407 [Phytophthora kernoviae]RLN78006.1 hypothetical protein BBO99_00006282 [Phytophthora kernoviae]
MSQFDTLADDDDLAKAQEALAADSVTPLPTPEDTAAASHKDDKAVQTNNRVQSSFPARLRPTTIPLPRVRDLTLKPVQIQRTAQAHTDHRSRCNLGDYRVRPGSRLFDFFFKPRYLQQVTGAKQRSGAGLVESDSTQT